MNGDRDYPYPRRYDNIYHQMKNELYIVRQEYPVIYWSRGLFFNGLSECISRQLVAWFNLSSTLLSLE